MSEETVTAKLIEGDVKTFENVFYEHSRELYFTAMGLCGDPAMAKDALQDSFVYLWEHRGGLKPGNSLAAYLRTIVRNNVLMQLRRQSLHTRHAPTIARENADSHADGDADLSRKVALVRHVIDNLPEECRRTFIMSVIEGMSYNDTAQKLGVSVNTVKSQVKIGYKKIREALPDINDKDLSIILMLILLQNY